MPSFNTTRRVPFTSRQMFDLVADVEQYPKFLPLCEALTVKKREQESDKAILICEMTVGYYALRETFTSRVTCERSESTILVEYIDGPFKHLENRWSFHDRDEGRACLVDFRIAYELKSRALGLIMGGMFDAAFRKFAEAFEDRADIVYGKGAS